MADLTETEIQTQITALNTALLSLVTSPKPSYSVGEHSVSWGEYHSTLLRQLELYRSLLSQLPAEETTIGRDW